MVSPRSQKPGFIREEKRKLDLVRGTVGLSATLAELNKTSSDNVRKQVRNLKRN